MRKLFALVVLLTLALSSCERRTADLLNVPIMTVAEARAAAIAAPQRARTAGSARIVTISRFQFEGKPVTFQGTGSVDFKRDRSVVTQNFGKFFEKVGATGVPEAFEYLFTPSYLFIGVPDGTKRPKTYLRLPGMTAGAILGQVGGGSTQVGDPADALAPLRGVGKEGEFIASEDVHGVHTSEFKFTLDPNAAVKRAPAKDRDAVRRALFGIGETLPVNVWVGNDGLVYRYSFSITVAEQTQSVIIDFYDYGKASSVAIPKRFTKVTNAIEFGQAFATISGPITQPSPSPTTAASASPSPGGSASSSPAPSGTSTTFTGEASSSPAP